MIKRYLQKHWIKYLTKHLFNTITKDDVLQIRKEGIFLNNRQLDATDIEALKEDAEKFGESTLWKLLSNEVKYACNQRMYERGKTDQDLLAGKLGLYTLEVIEKSMDEISKL